MTQITYIPKRYQEGFKNMSALSAEKFAAIQEGLSYTSLTSTIASLADKVAKIKNLDSSEVRDLFLSAGSLIPLLDNNNTIEEIVLQLTTIALSEKLVEEKAVDVFKDRLRFLISNEQVYYASKANALLLENGNVYIQARVLSDIRPVFSVKLEDPPKAVMTIHTLHLHFQADEEGNHKDIYIALDSKDVASLKEILIRAEKKDVSLQKLYDKNGLANLSE